MQRWCDDRRRRAKIFSLRKIRSLLKVANEIGDKVSGVISVHYSVKSLRSLPVLFVYFSSRGREGEDFSHHHRAHCCVVACGGEPFSFFLRISARSPLCWGFSPVHACWIIEWRYIFTVQRITAKSSCFFLRPTFSSIEISLSQSWNLLYMLFIIHKMLLKKLFTTSPLSGNDSHSTEGMLAAAIQNQVFLLLYIRERWKQ